MSGRETMLSGLSTAAPMSVEDALQRILSCLPRLPAETVALAEAAGRVLADDIVAAEDLWPFPRSAMDGFALRSSDVAAAAPDRPVKLRITGTRFAGDVPQGAVGPGEAMRIATGAPIPDGADAVLPIEVAEVAGTCLVARRPVEAGRHIFPAGEDAQRGEVVLARGTALRAGGIGLLASLGVTRVPVVRRADVAVLTVGDELVDPAAPLWPGRVRDSNSYALAAAVEEAGGRARRLGIARDHLEAVTARIREGLAADALIICAGMSVGERDVVRAGLANAGVHLLFQRVAMKPGAPAVFGMAGRTPVFGLPGNPGAAMVAFDELVRPALRTMMGYREYLRPELTAILTESVSVQPGRRRYMWARAEVRGGRITVGVLRGQGTATLRSVSDANALVVIEPEVASLERGALVRVQMLGALEPSARPGVPVLGVVGAKGAGKTFLIERLLPELRRRGYEVAALKHDRHGFLIDHPGTDTWRMSAAGARATAIAGPEQAAVAYRLDRELSLPEVVDLIPGVDLILAEGYSQEPTPKIVVRRAGVVSDKPEPKGRIVAVVTDSAREDGSLTFAEVSALADRIETTLLGGRR
ncbi:MAG TPA: gephyrin-like molybdotransferase Glp [bacterium]|nr:gephyrin-like molybdotransferase Glp [bacterium]